MTVSSSSAGLGNERRAALARRAGSATAAPVLKPIPARAFLEEAHGMTVSSLSAGLGNERRAALARQDGSAVAAPVLTPIPARAFLEEILWEIRTPRPARLRA